jgi:hypothetical protein
MLFLSVPSKPLIDPLIDPYSLTNVLFLWFLFAMSLILVVDPFLELGLLGSIS